MIFRALQPLIEEKLFQGKALIIMGARQVGKTTLLRQLFGAREDVFWLNGDDPETLQLLDMITAARWRQLIGERRIVLIDEAQRIPEIGRKMKLITDQLPDVQLVASGSSAFELANELNEPLTGRKWSYQMFPLSFKEMVDHHGWVEEKRQLPQRLVYGYYPDIVTNPQEAREQLQLLADSYLFKDILRWGQIKKSDKLVQLLQALAYQLGNEVSFHELGRTVGLASETVESYIQLLEQSYIVFRLPPLSRNLRKELKTKRKIYFYDNGIRNAIIAQFQPVEIRQDIGALWENWLISERKKWLHYHRIYANTFFWRTQDQQEIDYVEERDGSFDAFEIKWNPKAKVRFSKTFTRAYPQHSTTVLNRESFEEFLGVLS